MVYKKLHSNFGKFKKRNSVFFGVETNLSMSKEIRNTILKIFKLRNNRKNYHLTCSLWTNQKGLTELIIVQWPRAIKPKSQDD